MHDPLNKNSGWALMWIPPASCMTAPCEELFKLILIGFTCTRNVKCQGVKVNGYPLLR